MLIQSTENIMWFCVCERATWHSCIEANGCLILSGSGQEMKTIIGVGRLPHCPLYKLAPIMYIYSESHFAVW